MDLCPVDCLCTHPLIKAGVQYHGHPDRTEWMGYGGLFDWTQVCVCVDGWPLEPCLTGNRCVSSIAGGSG